MKKLFSYTEGVSKTMTAQMDLLLNEITQAVKKPQYERVIDLPNVLRGLSHDETVPPNTNNPTDDDIAVTVHLLARLEAEGVYETTKVSTGIFEYDFMKRIKLVHCMKQEYNILVKQIRTKYPPEVAKAV